MEVTHRSASRLPIAGKALDNPRFEKTGTRLASEMTNENGFAHAFERPGGSHGVGGSKILQPP
jgi:hypothetical protein